jgi:hypothetical protein
VLRGYRDTGRLLAITPLVVLWGAVASSLPTAFDYFYRPALAGQSAQYFLADAGATALGAFLATPAAIAIHRFIILDEAPMGRRIDFGRRTWRYVLWSFAFVLPAAVFGHLPAEAVSESEAIQLGITAGQVAGLVALLLLMVLFALLFPAIAVDAPGANWRRAARDMVGHYVRVVGILAFALSPVLLALVPIVLMEVRAAIEWFLLALVDAFSWTVSTPIASRLYQSIGSRVKQPAERA